MPNSFISHGRERPKMDFIENNTVKLNEEEDYFTEPQRNETEKLW
jgi:hypothetical protein